MPTPTALLARLCSDDGPPSRTVVVAAHPDDETIGMAGRLVRLHDAVTVLHVTDGSPADGRDARDHGFAKPILYEEARRAELEAAMSSAGVGADRLFTLRRPDQQASFDLAGTARAVAEFLGDARPEVVLTHPYEGGHPDHDAAAFAVAAACELLGPSAPARLEFTSYHMGPAGLTPYAFLPSDEPVTTVTLSPAERTRKRRMFNCFPTQRDTLQYFPVEVERFRVAPRYAFTSPPHAGTLFYEQYDWGLTGTRFGELAAAALAELGPPR